MYTWGSTPPGVGTYGEGEPRRQMYVVSVYDSWVLSWVEPTFFTESILFLNPARRMCPAYQLAYRERVELA